MITPQEINKRADRKYHEVLRAHLSGDNVFPLTFAVGRLSKKLSERRQQIDTLRQHSIEVADNGYRIEWKTVNKRDLGKQTTPKRIIIPDLDTYLTLLRRRTEFNDFCVEADKIRRKFPGLEDWLHRRPQLVLQYIRVWDDLLTVCDYFVKHHRPNRYARELPIEIHTKFIEQHTAILRELLDELLPPAAIDSSTTHFYQRFGLKEKPTLLRLRLLEEQLDWSYGLALDDLTLPIDQAAYLLAKHVQPKYVFIVENLINFLTLPPLSNSISIFGGGFGVHSLKEVEWLSDCHIIYWGDIDAHGFQILSDLRQIFEQTRSLMMDQQTFDTFGIYVGSGNAMATPRYDCLTADELSLADYVNKENLRLEQEHISHPYAVAQLNHSLKSIS